MDRLIFTSNSAIKEQAVARQVLVNELANVSTVGFKTSYDVALTSIKADGAGFDTRFQAQAVSRDYIRMTPGAVMLTGRPMDIAMAEQTVLAVQAANGDEAYTRRGDLRSNIRGQLETGSGHLVMGQNGPITVPANAKISINQDGSIYARDPAQPSNAPGVLVDRLRILDGSAEMFERREDGLFKVSGKPEGSTFTSGPVLPKVLPNSLEGSNVSSVEALTRLMDHSRTFELQIKIIKETKSLDESGATLMKAT